MCKRKKTKIPENVKTGNVKTLYIKNKNKKKTCFCTQFKVWRNKHFFNKITRWTAISKNNEGKDVCKMFLSFSSVSNIPEVEIHTDDLLGANHDLLAHTVICCANTTRTTPLLSLFVDSRRTAANRQHFCHLRLECTISVAVFHRSSGSLWPKDQTRNTPTASWLKRIQAEQSG